MRSLINKKAPFRGLGFSLGFGYLIQITFLTAELFDLWVSLRSVSDVFKVQDSGRRGQNCSGTVNWKTMFASLDPDGLSSERAGEDNLLVRLRGAGSAYSLYLLPA